MEALIGTIFVLAVLGSIIWKYAKAVLKIIFLAAIGFLFLAFSGNIGGSSAPETTSVSYPA